MFSRHLIRHAKRTVSSVTARHPPQRRALCSLGGLPSQFEIHPRTQQLIDDIDSSVLSFGQGQDLSCAEEVEVTGNAMTLESLIKLGECITPSTFNVVTH